MLNSFLFLIGFQLGLGFEINPLIIYGNFGLMDSLIVPSLFFMAKRKINRNLLIVLAFLLILSFLMALGNLKAELGLATSGSIIPVARAGWYVLFLLMLFQSNRTNLHAMLYGVSAGVIFYAFYSIILFLEAPRFYFGLPYLASEANNANTMSYFMTFGILTMLLLTAIRDGEGKRSILLVLGIIVCALVGFMTLSKTFWLSILIILFALMLLGQKKIRYFLVPVFLIAGLYLGPLVTTRIEASVGSNNHRLEMLHGGLEMVALSPLIGSGHQAYKNLGPIFNRTESDVHNVFVGFAIEYGLMTLLVFSFIYFILPTSLLLLSKTQLGTQAKYYALIIVLGLIWGLVTGIVYSDRLYLFLISLIFVSYFNQSEKGFNNLRSHNT